MSEEIISVGDTVKYVGRSAYLAGKLGIVRGIRESTGALAVEFVGYRLGHHCEGKVKSGHGWFCNCLSGEPHTVKLVKRKTPELFD